MYRLIDDLNSLNEESEQFIDEIEHMIVEEDELDEINDEDMHYYGEYKDLKITSREISGKLM